MNLFNEAIYKNHLEHTAEGTKWGKHKYLYITPSGRYVYPEDLKNAKDYGKQIEAQKRTAEAARGKKTVAEIMNKKEPGGGQTTMKTVMQDTIRRKQEAAAKTSGVAAGSKVVSTKTEESKKMGLSDDDLKSMKINTQATNRDEVLRNIALRTIRGDYGNGADRKAKLGNYYDEVQKHVNEILREGSIEKESQPKQENTSTKSSNTPSSNKSSNTSSGKEYKKEEYKKGDKDFDDKNYSDKNRLGNTDFFSYKRDDGKYVILEEDMKWVVDEKPSSKMIKNLEAMDEYIDARQKNGTWEGKNAAKEWDQLASIAINGGDLTERAKAEKAKVKNKKSVKHYDLEVGLFLKHWGKKRRSGRYRFGSGDRPYQHEARHRNSTFHDRRSMSNEDLDAAITRARKEVELYRAERDNRSQGQRFVEDVLTSIGKDVLKTAGRGALLWAGKNYATKVLKNEELGDFIARGGAPKKDKNK